MSWLTECLEVHESLFCMRLSYEKVRQWMGSLLSCGILQITCSKSPLAIFMESIGTQHASRQQTTCPE